MKKYLLVLFCCLFILSVSQIALFSQPAEEPAVNTAETEKKAELKEEPKKKTEVFTLGEIVIKKKRIANIENSTTTTIVTSEDIEAHSDKNLSNTLQTVPGFITYQHGKGHIRFKMRGFEMPYVALLVDGIPVTDVWESNVDISKIPVINASEIIINRGTCSALYGTSGTIGSINILTKKPVDLFTKAEAEYGINGDYNLNVAHGMPMGAFYYWITATVEKQAPYEISKKLDKSERQKWVNKFFPDLGYSWSSSPADTEALNTYLNDTGKWPHQEMFKYDISVKSGYNIINELEAGLTANFNQSKSKRYSLSITNTENYNSSTGEWTGGSYKIGSTAFEWPRVYSYTVAPYVNFEKGDFVVKGNIFYTNTYEILDGYLNESHTSVPNWGGTHSNWQNTASGFNIFPSYRLTEWNKLNGSILFRWDKHLEREKSMGKFQGVNSNATNSHTYHGDDWFNTKLATGELLTVAVEDEIKIRTVNISAGLSYDAQKLQEYKVRAPYGSTTINYSLPMTNQYKAKEDSLIWGTRDSFNPVTGVTYEPLKDFLKLRASYSQKTKLPTMAAYANVYPGSRDVGLKPEKSYNTNAGFELLFLDNAFSLRLDYFFTRFKDKLEKITDTGASTWYYTNIKGVKTQGLELITNTKFMNIAGVMDLNLGLSYVYVQITNLDTDVRDPNINKGKKIADNPEHQIIADVRMSFITKTSLNIFGEYTANAIKYTMRSNPNTTDPYSTTYFKEVKLHNPLMIHLKLSQKFLEKYEVYLLCKNIFDDYAADPFNPGPGRQFFFGLSAEL